MRSFVSGYAIIQLPEFLLSVYNFLLRKKSTSKELIKVDQSYNEKSLKERIERLELVIREQGYILKS